MHKTDATDKEKESYFLLEKCVMATAKNTNAPINAIYFSFFFFQREIKEEGK